MLKLSDKRQQKRCQPTNFELLKAFECFDIMGKHEGKFLIWLVMLIDYSSAQEPTYINTQWNGNCKLMWDVF